MLLQCKTVRCLFQCFEFGNAFRICCCHVRSLQFNSWRFQNLLLFGLIPSLNVFRCQTFHAPRGLSDSAYMSICELMHFQLESRLLDIHLSTVLEEDVLKSPTHPTANFVWWCGDFQLAFSGLTMQFSDSLGSYMSVSMLPFSS
jgi:hypothetical protein